MQLHNHCTGRGPACVRAVPSAVVIVVGYGFAVKLSLHMLAIDAIYECLLLRTRIAGEHGP